MNRFHAMTSLVHALCPADLLQKGKSLSLVLVYAGYDGYYYAANLSAYGDKEYDIISISTTTCVGATMYVWDALASTGLATQCTGGNSTGARHLLGNSYNELEAYMASLLIGSGSITHQRSLNQTPGTPGGFDKLWLPITDGHDQVHIWSGNLCQSCVSLLAHILLVAKEQLSTYSIS